LPRLDEVFGGTKAIDITTTSVERYKTVRLKNKSAPATVNRELASLKRMFRLGLRQGMVATMPYIAMLAEHNVRKGFFELDHFQAILKHLPCEFHALFEIAYITGWRMKSELLTRQWRHVDFGGKGWLRIDAGEAKDATAGREFQFTTWMREALERQRKFVSKVEKRTKAVIPWVFCRPDGVRIYRFYEPWRDACKATGIQRIPHDFRRTAVRNLERAGVPRRLRWRRSVTRRSRSTGATASSTKRCSKWAHRSWKHCNRFSGATGQLWSRCGNGHARPDRTVRTRLSTMRRRSHDVSTSEQRQVPPYSFCSRLSETAIALITCDHLKRPETIESDAASEIRSRRVSSTTTDAVARPDFSYQLVTRGDGITHQRSPPKFTRRHHASSATT
jgi:site-specific recombinase XerD